MSTFVGWIAFYKGKRLEIKLSDEISSQWEATEFARKQLKVSKSNYGRLAVEPAYDDKENQNGNNCF